MGLRLTLYSLTDKAFLACVLRRVTLGFQSSAGALTRNTSVERMKFSLGLSILIFLTMCRIESRPWGVEDNRNLSMIIQGWVEQKFPKIGLQRQEILMKNLKMRIEERISRRRWSPWRNGDDSFARML